jgi:hypothetical protein
VPDIAKDEQVGSKLVELAGGLGPDDKEAAFKIARAMAEMGSTGSLDAFLESGEPSWLEIANKAGVTDPIGPEGGLTAILWEKVRAYIKDHPFDSKCS